MLGPQLLADVAKGRSDRVKKIRQCVADCLGKIVEDEFCFIKGVRPFVADLICLPDGLNHLINTAVDAVTSYLGAARISPFLKQVGDGRELFENGPPRCFRGMGSEYRSEVRPVDKVANLSGGNTRIEKASDCFSEVTTRPGTANIEVLDTVLLLGNVG